MPAPLEPVPPVADLAESWMRVHVNVNCKPSTPATRRGHVDCRTLPAVGEMALGAVGRGEVAALHHRLRDTPPTANAVVRTSSTMFHLAEAWESNPTRPESMPLGSILHGACPAAIPDAGGIPPFLSSSPTKPMRTIRHRSSADSRRRELTFGREFRDFGMPDGVYKLDILCKDVLDQRTGCEKAVAKPGGTMGEMMGFLEEGIPALSRSARAFVRHRPREARLAVTVALEAAAAQCEAEEAGAGADVPERLRPFIVRRVVEHEIVGVSEAAARLEVSRTTVYEWVRRNTLLAWTSTKRGLRIPAAQILGPGRVVPGMAGVVDIIGAPELAWAFLTQEWPFEDEAALPLELLKAGRTEEVISAAPGFGATFS